MFLARKLCNLTKAPARIRRFASFSKSGASMSTFFEDGTIWSESNWSSVAKQFNKTAEFPMPGQTGICTTHVENRLSLNSRGALPVEDFKQKQTKLSEELKQFDLFYRPLPSEKQVAVMSQVNNLQKEMDEENFTIETKNELNGIFDLKAQECPLSLVKDFQNYFPMTHEARTIITVSVKSENDMSLYSNQIEEEREVLMKKFVDIAQEICLDIKKQGYWVDFIDPSSGRPMNSPFSHATFYETDERYRHLGFDIIDYGCCKVISHHKWGTKAYVGSILTTASHGNKFIQELVSKYSACSA